jgi:probable DNA metabolism protein
LKRVYLCQDTIKGIFSAFYDAWRQSRDGDVGIQFLHDDDRQLFCVYIDVMECDKKVVAVERLIRNNLGNDSYHDIYMALLANDLGKAEAVFKVICDARKLDNSKDIMNFLSNKNVLKVFELCRRVAGEAHLLQGFIRFRELRGGGLYAEITPKSQVLTCLAEYFENRYPLENWLIYDKTHKLSLVHPKGKPCFLLALDEINQEEIENLASHEDMYQELWEVFFNSVSIKERKSYKLQRNNLPLRYRKNMVEFLRK